jgi:hypothetical protein
LESDVLLNAIEIAIKEYQKIIEDKKKSDIPQADDLNKVMAIPFLISQGFDTDYKMAKYFQFTKRQSSYYRKAAEILGLAGTNKNHYYLTEEGKKYILLPNKIQKKYFARLLLEFPVIKKLVNNLNVDPNKQFTKNDLVKILKGNSTLTGQTLTRRAQTISKWLEWIENNMDLVEL